MNEVFKFSYKILKIRTDYRLAVIFLVTAIMRPSMPIALYSPYQGYRMVVCTVLILWSLHRQRGIFFKLMPILLYSIVIPLSSIVNHRGVSNLSSSVVSLLMFFAIFLVTAKFLERYELTTLYHLLLRVFFVYTLINDVTVLMLGGSSSRLIRYLVGTKFSVAYLHWMLLALFAFTGIYEHGVKKNLKVWLLFAESALIILITRCTTGLLGLVLLMAIWLTHHMRFVKWLLNRKHIPISFGASIVLYLGLDLILKNSFINNIITTLLNESSTLTGRTTIYSYLSNIIAKKPWLGYGLESGVVKQTIGWGGNTQNGIMQTLVFYGVIGLVGLVAAILISCLRGRNDTSDTEASTVMIILLLLASIVEISFNYYFFLSLAIIYARANLSDQPYPAVKTARRGLKFVFSR